MLEKTEVVTTNGQCRDTDNIRHTRHKTKTNNTQKHSTTQKTHISILNVEIID